MIEKKLIIRNDKDEDDVLLKFSTQAPSEDPFEGDEILAICCGGGDLYYVSRSEVRALRNFLDDALEDDQVQRDEDDLDDDEW